MFVKSYIYFYLIGRTWYFCKILYLLHFNRENLVFLEAPLGKMVKVSW